MSLVAKTDLKIKARAYRQDGKSYIEISKNLGVSTSTVSKWCGDISLNEEQIKALENRMLDPHYGRRWSYLKKIKENYRYV